MSGKKGMQKYPAGIQEVVVKRIREGESQRATSRKYGISRYATQEWMMEGNLINVEVESLQRH